MKLLKYCKKQFILPLFILICFGSLAFCLFKVTYILLSKPIPKTKTQATVQNKQKPTFLKTKLTKNMFFLTLNDFKPFQDQANLTEDNNYFILKTIPNQEKQAQCLYGVFKLVAKHSHQLNFSVLTQFNGKKIDQYGLLISKHLKYSVLSKEQLPANIVNCKNWLYIENAYQFSNQKYSSIKKRNVLFSTEKCSFIPSKNIIAIYSENPKVLHFSYDMIQNKLKMCIKDTGGVFVRIITLNNGNSQTEYLNVIKSNKLNRIKNKVGAKFLNYTQAKPKNGIH